MDVMFILSCAIVVFCVLAGGRLGGIGLGAGGSLAVFILALFFGVKPGSPPITAMLIILTVVTAVGALQSSGGLDLMVRMAEKMLRKRPQSVTFVAPLLCAGFACLCGTSYVSYSIYPVIAEVAASAGVRPERPISNSVIASACGVCASPMSAVTAVMIGLLSVYGINLFNILSITIPAIGLGTVCGSLSIMKRGKELREDPEFLRRLASGEYKQIDFKTEQSQGEVSPIAKRCLIVFAIALAFIIFLGANHSLMPSYNINGKTSTLSIPVLIQMTMMVAVLFMFWIAKLENTQIASSSVFRSGLVGLMAVFGLSWLSDTFFATHLDAFEQTLQTTLQSTPMLFAAILFLFSMVTMSPSATAMALMPLGLSLGIDPKLLVVMLPACNGDFIIPGGQQIGCVSFDRTGTTKIGKFVVNHSFIRPGFVTIISAICIGYLIYLI